jgi:hypothetical protein
MAARRAAAGPPERGSLTGTAAATATRGDVRLLDEIARLKAEQRAADERHAAEFKALVDKYEDMKKQKTYWYNRWYTLTAAEEAASSAGLLRLSILFYVICI